MEGMFSNPMKHLRDGYLIHPPHSQRTVNLLLVSFHSMMATFSAAAIQSGFVDIAEDFHISVQRASYLTSLFIVVLGAAPLFWRSLGQTYGRRPIFLISLIGSLVGNIGCAKSPSYSTMGLCRAITAWFISPAASLGSAVVAESFAKKDRARYMGVWTTMVTLGVPLAPFIFGFVTVRVGYRWTYWILAIVSSLFAKAPCSLIRNVLTSSKDQRSPVRLVFLSRFRD